MKNYVVAKQFVSEHAGVISVDSVLKGPVAGLTTPEINAEVFKVHPATNTETTGEIYTLPITAEEIAKFCVEQDDEALADYEKEINVDVIGGEKLENASEIPTNEIKFNVSEHDSNKSVTDCPFNSKMRVAGSACQACKHHVKLNYDVKTVTCSASGGHVAFPTPEEIRTFMKKPCNCPDCQAKRAKGERQDDKKPKSEATDMFNLLGGLLGSVMDKSQAQEMITEPTIAALTETITESIEGMSITFIQDPAERKEFIKTTLAAVVASLTETLDALNAEEEGEQ